jgi:transcriptional regulator with XRE-family HTH domain
MENTNTNAVSLDHLICKHIGKRGTKKREAFENELKIDLLGHAIKKARKERNLTQAALGNLVGVQKAQISKIENSVKSARIETILKVFNALGAKVKFTVVLDKKHRSKKRKIIKKKLKIESMLVRADSAEMLGILEKLED